MENRLFPFVDELNQQGPSAAWEKFNARALRDRDWGIICSKVVTNF